MRTSNLHPTNLLVLTLLLLFSAVRCDSSAAPGDVDLSFDPGSGINGTVRAVARQSDGKLIVAGPFTTVKGFARPGLARLHADGSGDSSFNPGQLPGEIFSVALQPDGKVLVGHYSGIARLNSDGSADTSFSATMQALSEYDGVYAIAVQADGKVLIGGQFSAVNGSARQGFARLNANGTLDPSFNFGADSSYVSGLALQADGKILVTGNFSGTGTNRIGIVRINADGTRDNTFTAEAHNSQSCETLAAQPDGKILVSGSFAGESRLVRLNANGSLDGSFKVWGGVAAITLQPDGKVLAAQDAVVFRLLTNGELDGSFDSAMRVLNSAVLSIVVQSDGKVLIGGGFTKIDGTIRNRMARLDVDGSLDISFDPGAEISGDVSSQVSSVVVQSDGKVLIGGWFTSVQGVNRSKIARLSADGTLDTTFAPGTGIATSSAVHSVGLQPDGKVVIGGTFGRDGIARLNTDGNLDTNSGPDIAGIPHPNDCPFGYACWVYTEVKTVLGQTDGKVLTGGNFITVVYGQQEGEETYQLTRYFVARFNADGTRDAQFQTSMGNTSNSQLLSMALQPDGKAVLAGNFPSSDGLSWRSLIRINSDGSGDNGFAGPWVGRINAVAVQPDGRVLIGGEFSSVNGTNRYQLARLSAEGSLDSSFNLDTRVSADLYTILLQPDGKVLIGGGISLANSLSLVARLNSNGRLDESFHLPPGSGVVESMALQPDGNVLIGGRFLTVDGAARPQVARLFGDAGSPPNIPPTVRISSPVDGSTYAGLATVDIDVDAADSDGSIARVDLYVGDTFLTSDSAAPFEISWENVPSGNYVLTADAIDNYAATSTSAAVNIVVTNTTPSVAISNPASGSRFPAPASIAITIDALDRDGTITQVDVYAGQTLIGSDSSAPFEVTWNNAAAGDYAITARATDNLGATHISAPINLTITAASRPAAPTGLTTTALARRQIDLRWNDNAANELGFIITRSINGRPFKEIARVGENITTFADSGVRIGTKYFYRVRAFNSLGNSPSSNTAAARVAR